jgi:hypothetical protein
MLLTSTHSSSAKREKTVLRVLNIAGAYVLYLALAIALQYSSGAFQAELTAYPDEPAHYVTGVMLYECIQQNCFGSPVRFAEQYYIRYPKVAIGHWPPGLYVAEALWGTVFGPGRVSFLILQAVLTALLALGIYLLLRRHVGRLVAMLFGVVWVCLPVVQEHTSMFMAEGLLALLCFAAVVVFARYTASQDKSLLVSFVLFTSLAILTKGTGWLLGLAALLIMAFTGTWHLLKRKSLWIAGAVVLAVCLPWQLSTNELAAHGWERSDPSFDYTLRALPSFATLVTRMTGWVIVVAALAGLLAWRTRARDASWRTGAVAMVALFLAVWLFHSMVPAGVEPRKMMLALPAVLFFAASGCAAIAGLSRSLQARAKVAVPLLALAVIAGFAIERFSVFHKQSFGFRETAAKLVRTPPDTAILVSSTRDGEGLLVSELAFLRPRPTHFVLRASKQLAYSDYNGTEYIPQVRCKEDLDARMKELGVAAVVLDNRQPLRPVRAEHHRWLREIVTASPDWKLTMSAGEAESGQASVLVYESTVPRTRSAKLSVDLKSRIGRILTVD